MKLPGPFPTECLSISRHLILRPLLQAAFLFLLLLSITCAGRAQTPAFRTFQTNQTTYVITKGSVNNVFTNIPMTNTTLLFLGSDPTTVSSKANLGITWNTLATVGGVSTWSFNSVSPTNAGAFSFALVASNAVSKLTATQTVTITVVAPDPSVLPGLVPGSNTITTPLNPNVHLHTNLPTTNLPATVGIGVGTTWSDDAALSSMVVSPDNNSPNPWRVNLSFFPKKAGTYSVPVLLTNENTGWSNSNNVTVIVTPPTDVPDFTNCPASITNILSTNQQTADLGGFTNVAASNCNVVIVSQTPPDAVSTYSITAGVNQTAGVGQLTYTPGIVPTNVALGLVVSNTVSGISGPTNTVMLNFVPLKPLEVRVRNNTGVPDNQMQIMQIDTGTDAFPNNVYFLTNGVQQMVNGLSTNFNALPSGNDINGPYRTLYISNSVSGTLWFCLSNVPYNKGEGGNPAVVNTKWSGLPFGNVELAYFGSGYDTVDVTAINQLGIPMKLAMMTNPMAPIPLPDGVRGFTTALQASNLLVRGLQVPGSPWFGPAPNTNLITLVGPSSAGSGGLVMSAGGNTNVAGPGPTPGSLHLGWPGFTFPPMSTYVTKVSVEQTNGTWPQPTQIVKTVGDPQSDNVFTFRGTLAFATNTNTGDPNYLTPVPILTNVSIFVTNSKTSFSTNVTGLWVQYTPDNGSPSDAWFSSYIYAAPASFTNPVGTYTPSLQAGYVQFMPNGSNWFAANVGGSSKWSANVLDSFLNDIAFGFAGGFVHSPVMGWTNGWVFTNGGNTILGNSNTGAPNTMIGLMDSEQWWNQTNLYSQLQPNSPILSPSNKITWYSSYGDNLFRAAPDVYNHPISDRMKYIKFQPGLGLGAANLDTNVWLEISLQAPPSSAAAAAVPAITSSTNVTNAYATAETPALISYQVTAVNTNGGGIYVGSLPEGLNYNPFTQMITGSLKTNVSGYVNIGLMAYSSNSASIAQLPIYLVASVAPNGLVQSSPLNFDRGQAYLAPSNISIPEYPSSIQQLSVSNGATSMLGTPQDCFFYATNGTLPRGIYLTNIAVGNVVYGYFYGVPVDFQTGLSVDLVAKNPVGSSTTPMIITNAGQANLFSAGVLNPPGYLGSASLNVTSGQFTNLVLNYTNSPTYFTNDPSTPLPPGLSFQVALNPSIPQGQAASPPFIVSLAGTPVGTPGTSTNIKILAVNAYVSNSAWAAGTNTNTITLNFSGAAPSPYLTYSDWVGAWALSGSNTNTTADPDDDGFDNNDEYAFGGNPTNPTPYLINISGSNISYLGLTNNVVPSPYTVQNTTNLATGPWTNYPTTVTNATNQLNIPLPSYYQRKEFTVPVTAGTNNFYRVIFSNQ
jgi:hypothetical protein